MKKLLFIPLLFICSVAFAAPAIVCTSGTLSQDSTVVLSGTGFGSGDTTPICYDNFEDGTDGNSLSASPQIGTWDLNSSPTPIYSTAHAYAGSQSSYGYRTSDDTDNLFTQFQLPDTTGPLSDTYYYASWWGKYNNPSSTAGQVKLVQLWGTYQVGDYNPGFFSGNGSATYIALENTGMTELVWIDEPAEETWHLYELILKQSTVDTADGSITLIRNGVTDYDEQNVKTRERVGESWQKLIPWEGMTNQAGITGTRYLAVDNIYFNNSWARVVVCNNATYSSATVRELCVATEWTDSSISITFNQGAFMNGQTAYMFVVDSFGTVSSGYEVTIGGETTEATSSISGTVSLTGKVTLS